MKIRYWPQERTFVITWGTRRIIVGLTGHDRPSVLWHLRLKWRRWRYRAGSA